MASQAFTNSSRNFAFTTSLSRKRWPATKSFRRRSWIIGWFGSYPGGGRLKDSPLSSILERRTFFQESGSSTIRSRIFLTTGGAGGSAPGGAAPPPGFRGGEEAGGPWSRGGGPS